MQRIYLVNLKHNLIGDVTDDVFEAKQKFQIPRRQILDYMKRKSNTDLVLFAKDESDLQIKLEKWIWKNKNKNME